MPGPAGFTGVGFVEKTGEDVSIQTGALVRPVPEFFCFLLSPSLQPFPPPESFLTPCLVVRSRPCPTKVVPLKPDCGTFRNFAVLHEDSLLELPKTEVQPDKLGCLMHFVHAYEMMQSVEVLKPGDTIIQADPCSLVGQAVIQLAKVRGRAVEL